MGCHSFVPNGTEASAIKGAALNGARKSTVEDCGMWFGSLSSTCPHHFVKGKKRNRERRQV